MMIYIHGFSGSGKGVKASIFRSRFEKNGFLSPSLSYIPDLAVDTLEQLVKTLENSHESLSLIGSSLGGYYALYLSQRYDLKTVLINPSIYPFKTLDLWKGFVINFYDESSFEWNEKHIQSLKKYYIKDIKNQQNILLMLQEDDELLDPEESLKKLPQSQKIITRGGGHSFEGIEKYFPDIQKFLKRTRI